MNDQKFNSFHVVHCGWINNRGIGPRVRVSGIGRVSGAIKRRPRIVGRSNGEFRDKWKSNGSHRSSVNRQFHRGKWGEEWGAVNPICRRVRSGTRFTLDNAIPTGHQSVLADLIPFGSTISVERYFIERPRSNSRFFSSFFASIFVRRRDSMCAQRYAVTLVNIEVRKEDGVCDGVCVYVYFLAILSKGFPRNRFVHSIGILWNFERWVFESLVIIL